MGNRLWVMKRNTKNRQKGSLLLEVILATALFVVVVTGFFDLLKIKEWLITDARDVSIASATARREIENILAMDYSDISNLDGQRFLVEGLAPAKDVYGLINVKTIKNPSMKRITVSIFYGKGRMISYTTLRSK